GAAEGHCQRRALEDCDGRRRSPKIDDYATYLFILTHGVHPESSVREFRTRQLALFLGPNYLVSFHREASRSVVATLESVRKNPRLMADGPGMILYRTLDFQMDLYLPMMENFQKRVDEIEKACFEAATSVILRDVFDLLKAPVRPRRIPAHPRG